ncbi:phosphotransferase enzyme family protein [Alicyclobacillus sp. ALC3]|uniref:phosphotransferase enzyme family protein n=1 Tax=Alicyclobacillus sp. ALC3 TaxID=2796143 RepID=UPI002378D124|nr:phosphotransferase [Alicyclobacillus sp. ALC3]WDL95969.1 phosphotransferase [Alicyclobacillus sp. ALC3]
MNTFPVMHSLLASEALANFVSENYSVGQVVTCKLLSKGLNDTYLIGTSDDSYVLRVYRTPWRSKSEVLYELEVLDFLAHHGASVSAPVPNGFGQLACEVPAPEGMRCLALFTYAEGRRTRLNPDISFAYGQTVGQLHSLTDDFVSTHTRPGLDFAQLLDEPIRRFSSVMTEFGGDIAYVQAFACAIRDQLSQCDLNVGFCHGDVHDWNAHWNGNELTFFDFDCCGPGYRAYDLAVFLWNLKTNYKGEEAQNWASFIDGYRTVRTLTDSELQSIPWFVAARRIWLAGVYLSNEDVWGTGIINEGFFRAFVDQLKGDESDLGVQIG